MTRNLFSVRSNTSQKRKIPFPENYSGAMLYENFLLKKLEENKGIKLKNEIKKKKYEISKMFKNKFGPNFLNVKPDSLIIFQKLLGQYLFDPDSQFLSHFPKLQRKLKYERKISEFKLKDKIDIGAMIFYDLRTKNKKKTRHLAMAKEKIFTVSKNFEATPIKDLVQSEYYKTTFWKKNREKLNKYFKRNFTKNIDNYFIKEEKEEDHSQTNNEYEDESVEGKEGEESEDKSSINDSIVKNFKEKNIENLKLTLKQENNKPEKTDIKEKEMDFTINKTNSKKEEKKLISSYKLNSIPKIINLKNKFRNIRNQTGLFANSNTFKNSSYNISYSKVNNSNNSNFLNTMINLNLNYTKGFIAKSNIFPKRFKGNFSQKKKITSLKNKHHKFKYKLDNQITKLNQYTNKCNTELIKLIDINNDDNYTERKKKYLNRNKLDIKGILIEKKYNKKIETDSETDNDEIEKESKTEKPIEIKDTIKTILESARSDLKDNFGGQLVPLNKEKILKKQINNITDEQALGLVEDFLPKEKELDIRKLLGTDSKLEKKKKKEMKSIRLKTEKNYDKMIRLKNQIMIDKGKIFKELDKIDIN